MLNVALLEAEKRLEGLVPTGIHLLFNLQYVRSLETRHGGT
jgi:hypothetical protein